MATNSQVFSAYQLRLLLRRQKGQGWAERVREGLAAPGLAKRAKYLVALPK